MPSFSKSIWNEARDREDRHPSRNICRLTWESSTCNQHPSQPAKVDQPDGQEHEWEPQPQTAALPGGSSATEPLYHRFVRSAHDAPLQSPELDAAQDRERQAHHCQGGTNR